MNTLPPICHPQLVRDYRTAFKQATRRFCGLAVLITLVTLGWPTMISIGHVPDYSQPIREAMGDVSTHLPPLSAAEKNNFRDHLEDVNEAIKVILQSQHVTQAELLNIEIHQVNDGELHFPRYEAAFFLSNAKKSRPLWQALQTLTTTKLFAEEVVFQVHRPMPNYLALSVKVRGHATHDVGFYFPAFAEAPPPAAPRQPATPRAKPQIAIVIDDLGETWDEIQPLFKLGPGVTHAILPETPYGLQIAAKAHQARQEVFLHLPMEPNNPRLVQGTPFLMTTMPANQLQALLKSYLDFLPGLQGVNNHMGSRFTQDHDHMVQVLEALKGRGLYFLDSRTTNATLAYATARQLGVAAGTRDVFLDHNRRPKAIAQQFQTLRRIARLKGHAIAIGHPYPETLRLLAQEMRALKKEGFELVPARRISTI